MELLRSSCSPDAFLFYTSKLDSMASSLETLLTHRRAKKAARFRGFIDHSFTDNSVNQLVNNTNASNNDMSSNVTHNVCNSTVTRKRSRRKSKAANIQLDHSSVINLSSSSLSADEISVLARGRTFCPTPRHINWSDVSADIYDSARRMRLAEYFFDENSNTPTDNEHDTPFQVLGNLPPPPPPPPTTGNELLRATCCKDHLYLCKIEKNRFSENLSGRRFLLTCFKTVTWRLFGFLSSSPDRLLYFARERAKLGPEIALFAKAGKPKYCAWLEKLTHIINM